MNMEILINTVVFLSVYVVTFIVTFELLYRLDKRKNLQPYWHYIYAQMMCAYRVKFGKFPNFWKTLKIKRMAKKQAKIEEDEWIIK